MYVTPNTYNIYLLRIIHPAFILSIACAVQGINIVYIIDIARIMYIMYIIRKLYIIYVMLSMEVSPQRYGRPRRMVHT